MVGKSYGTIQVTDLQDEESDKENGLSPKDENAALLSSKDENNTTERDQNATPEIFSFLDSAEASSSSFMKAIRPFWNSLTFNWISPLLDLGNSKDQIDIADLRSMPLPSDCETNEVYRVFSECWEAELKRAKMSRIKSRSGSVNLSPEKAEVSKLNEVDDWEIQMDDSPLSHYQPSLIRALFNAFGRDFLKAGLLKLVHDMMIFVGPQVLNRLIQFIRNKDAQLSEGLYLTSIVTISQILMSLCLRHYFYKCYNCGLRIRTSVIVAIYRKSLVLASKERHAHGGPGEIVNLVGIDAQRMQDLMTYLHAIWYSFVQIGLAVYFLWGQVGPSCLAGVVIIFFLIPITKFVAAWLGGIQKTLMRARDERVALNNEILGAMKVIKIQAWEENFRSKLLSLRNYELVRLKHYFIAGAISVVLWSSAPLLVALATFAAYTLSGHTMDVAEALTALALFEILRFPLFMFPQIINRMVEAGISFERVRVFLLCEEHKNVGEGWLKTDGEVWIKNGTFVYDSKKPRLENSDGQGAAKSSGGGGIQGLMKRQKLVMQEAALDRQWEMMLLKAQLLDAEGRIEQLEKQVSPELVCSKNEELQASFNANDYDEEEEHWSPSSLLALRRVCMHCKAGDFVAVVGAVGSGKSTLINSILGEGRPLTGSGLAVKGKLAAFLQTPFIMNDTVRNNILFAHSSSELLEKSSSGVSKEAIDEDRYKLAIKVCSLTHDLKLLPHGDKTEIGEKGITLSGGQKARVSLARAVYHDADVYLLDDPLAAVDAHVGKDLFHKCIVDELLLGKSKKRYVPATPDIDSNRSDRNATVILVTNAIQFLSHPMVDKIICLRDGCVEEVGTFSQLSSDPNSRFSSFLAVMAETSKAALGEEPPSEIITVEEEEEDDSSVNALNFGNEPEVAKVIDPSPRRMSRTLSKRKSLISVVDPDEAPPAEDDKGKGALMTDELQEREKGSVDRKVYIAWAKSGGGIWNGVAILAFFAIVEGLNVMSKWWLTHWSEDGGSHQVVFLGIYALINFSAIFATFFRLLLFVFVGLRASRSMFEQLLDVVLHAPMSFFDTTPIGRIINRFSKDMYTVDEQLLVTARSYLSTMVSVISTIFVICSVTPLFIVALVPIIIFYLAQQEYFTKTYRELKRLDSVTRSPIYALLGETLDGVLTIRAFSAQNNLKARMESMLNTQQNAYFLTFAAQCWLSVRLEFAGTMIVMFACFVAVIQHGSKGGNELFAGLAGLSISFALSITQTLNWTVRMSSDLEANMVAVERIQQYFKIPIEAPRAIKSDSSLPPNWPTRGKVDFIDARLRYRPGLPLVLKGLRISIPAQSKVGVVGRTGAGKSTLMVALLRIVELDSGRIEIDGVDIKSVGLLKLRSKIAVIPQDPVLFSGTVRSNLDPFDEYEDAKLFEALGRVGLYTPMEKVSSKNNLASDASVSSGKGGGRTQPIKSLSEEVLEAGTNFSVGQRQLLVIARAMLAGASVVIMDEATASVDADTDARIQRVLREEFKDATCITIAHRLNTIMDSDFVLVMDDGQAAEFDKPSSLVSKNGIFKSLVDAWEEEN